MDIGTRLSMARGERGLTLRDISRITKIPVRCLEAIDRNDIDQLPGGIFTRAFLRSYAAEVGLDPTELLNEYSAQRQLDELELPPESFEVPSGAVEKSSHRSLSALAVILVIGVALGVLFLWTSANSVARVHQRVDLPLNGPEIIVPTAISGSPVPALSPPTTDLQRDVRIQRASGETPSSSTRARSEPTFATEARDEVPDSSPSVSSTPEPASDTPATEPASPLPTEDPSEPTLN